MEGPKYYFVVASTQFLVEEEPLEEVLRERAQYYTRTKKRIDFWLLPNPEFLQAESFKVVKNKISSPSLAIVSSNKIFITWLKLRLNDVFVGEFIGPSDYFQKSLVQNLFATKMENLSDQIQRPLDFFQKSAF